MSSFGNSNKRARADDGPNERPSKKPCPPPSVPPTTGLEEDEEDLAPAPMVPATKRTSRFNHAYEKRRNSTDLRVKADRARLIPSTWDVMDAGAQQGMKNITGVLCYRHSLLQGLLHLPKFSNFLEIHQPENCEEDYATCLGCNLLAAKTAYWSGDRGMMNEALQWMRKVCDRHGWGSNQQEDPSEHLIWMHKILEQQLPEIETLRAIQEMKLTTGFWCSACRGPSSRPSYLSQFHMGVSLQPRIHDGTLEDYIHTNFRDEIPADYKCGKCNGTSQPKERRSKIIHSPDNLVVSLQRYTWDGRKDSHPVRFGATLDLNRYRHKRNIRNTTYELSAVVSHIGGVDGGHYRCVAKGPDGKWNIFDDESVTPTTESQATNPGAGRGGWTPYILFYERIVPEEGFEEKPKANKSCMHYKRRAAGRPSDTQAKNVEVSAEPSSIQEADKLKSTADLSGLSSLVAETLPARAETPLPTTEFAAAPVRKIRLKLVHNREPEPKLVSNSGSGSDHSDNEINDADSESGLEPATAETTVSPEPKERKVWPEVKVGEGEARGKRQGTE